MKHIDERHAAVFIAVLLGVAIFVYSKRDRNMPVPSAAPPLANAPASMPQGNLSGTQDQVITINDREWRGVASSEPTKHITGKILTDDVWWEIRIDGDDSKVYSNIPPRNLESAAHYHLETEEGNLSEWRIMPGQAIHEAKLLVTIGPRQGH